MLGTAYPLASEGALDAVLSERDRPDGERRPIPRAAWSFVAPGGGASSRVPAGTMGTGRAGLLRQYELRQLNSRC
jgi:hypothetical protein